MAKENKTLDTDRLLAVARQQLEETNLCKEAFDEELDSVLSRQSAAAEILEAENADNGDAVRRSEDAGGRDGAFASGHVEDNIDDTLPEDFFDRLEIDETGTEDGAGLLEDLANDRLKDTLCLPRISTPLGRAIVTEGATRDRDDDAASEGAPAIQEPALAPEADGPDQAYKDQSISMTDEIAHLVAPQPHQPDPGAHPDAHTNAIPGVRQNGASRLSVFEMVTPIIFWASLGCMIASVVYALIVGAGGGVATILLWGGVFSFLSLLLFGSISGVFSPLLLSGMIFRRVRGMTSLEAVQLAGKDVLRPLGIAEDILNVDLDARLVTTKDGAVIYANEAYQRIAQQAGIAGAAGLPPRIDRLFAQAGPESRKIFHLCRAAKSAVAADEVILQIMGTGRHSRQRRFEINVRPMRDREQHIAWRLREHEVENLQEKFVTAYQDFPRAVFGLERSGRIAWMNNAMSEQWHISTNAVLQFNEIVLGEAEELINLLWENPDKPVAARLRLRKGKGVNVTLTPFRRDGFGEGFLCIELQQETVTEGHEATGLTGDMTDAPFGVALIEGDIGSDAKIIETNKHFAETFAISHQQPQLAESFSADVIRDLSNSLKTRSANAALARPVVVPIGEGATAKFMHLYARPVKRRRGSYGKRRMVFYVVDVTFQKRMEEDYSQDQKLKTIGHLAGSIAHDFNNLLLVVMGSCEFLMRRHAAGDPSYSDLVLIQQNAQRAKNLTSNLLAFSRKQTLQSEVMSVTDLLRDFSPFLNRSITERVQLDLINGRGLPPVKADKGQLELAVMNLAVNARDAMPTGGTLRVETKHIKADEVAAYEYAVLDEIDYVLIEVADTGPGVPLEIADKIFEPFFTTKGEGKGTGLGLSTVYGVIGQMGGRIFLLNEPGNGATFRIFLPAYEIDAEDQAQGKKAPAEISDKRPSENADLTGKGRILIVEDEDGARSIIVRALEMCGYEIIEACDGDEALELLQQAEQPFDLVLSDIMMPEMDGPTMVAEAGDKLVNTKVIFMSGYAEGAMREKLDQIEGAGYLQKPFSLKVVARKVKDALSA